MSTSQKVSDADIVKWNSLGFSLGTIGTKLQCHPTTVTIRLKSLNIEPADTRRAFMEDVLRNFSEAQLDKLAAKLGPNLSIKDDIRNLLAKDLL